MGTDPRDRAHEPGDERAGRSPEADRGTGPASHASGLPTGPLEAFQRRRRYAEVAARIEALAAEYVDRAEPLRGTLNSILSDDPSRWLRRLYEIRPHFSGLKLSDLPYGCDPGTSPSSLARHTLLHLGDAAGKGDRAVFEQLLSHLEGDPPVLAAAVAEFPVFACVVMGQFYKRTRTEFVPRVKALLADAGVEWSEHLIYQVAEAGGRLSATASDAVRHWLDPFDAQAHWTTDRLLAPPGWRRPDEETPAEAATTEAAEPGPDGTTRPTGAAAGRSSEPPAEKAPREGGRDGSKPDSRRRTRRDEIIGALTKHHAYDEGGCGNLDPIGVRDLAEAVGCSPSTVTEFFDREFGGDDRMSGHSKYQVVCRNGGRLADSLKALRGEFAPHDLYGRRPAGEGDRDGDD